MCGNDYLAYDLQVGPNEWTSWGTSQMMAADEYVWYVREGCDPDKRAENVLDALFVRTRWEFEEVILNFRNRVIAQSFRLPRLDD